ncbi:ankyrin repeat domain-containing protein [Agarivorans aestuarii]|uniref:Ankyrin repeat domain-containing protein n=1 Tax=Agarivorans aestuarii TaxID=1563703 RepID=A0ABU7G311_9ALTE|nr:ankyrin repeat domain-containing protein [Agarivorans aestuarii]MEE1673776.1 ankyrin repeat domain-containing protein [Agarivorans aestuarii]
MKILKSISACFLVLLFCSCQNLQQKQYDGTSNSLNSQSQNHPNRYLLISAAINLDIPAFSELVSSLPQNETTSVSLSWTVTNPAYSKKKHDIKQAEFIRLFGQYFEINKKNERGQTALLQALQFEQAKTLKAIIELNPDLTIRDRFGYSALEIALLSGDEKIVIPVLNKLNEQKINEKIADDAIVNLAAMEGRGDYGPSEISYELLKQGVNVDAANAKGQTALCLAVATNKPMTIRVLLEAGANLNHQDNNGWTPLMYAVRFGRLGIARTLLSHPLNLNLENKDGKKAIDMTYEPTSFGGTELQSMIRELILDA